MWKVEEIEAGNGSVDSIEVCNAIFRELRDVNVKYIGIKKNERLCD